MSYLIMRCKKQNISKLILEVSQKNDIAEKFYDNAFFSIKAIPLRMRFAIVVARRVYRRIGYKVLRCGDFETYEKSGRIYVRNFE